MIYDVIFIFAIAFVIVFVLVVLINEFVTYLVYGSPINEKKLEMFLSKNLDFYYTSSISKTMLFGGGGRPYISKSTSSVLFKWHIEDSGTIPRWSKWSKVIDQRYKQSDTKSSSRIDKFI